MSLKEILLKLATDGVAFRLADGTGSYQPKELLESLTRSKLAIRSHYQPGMYIARISDTGYLGTVLYRIEESARVTKEE